MPVPPPDAGFAGVSSPAGARRPGAGRALPAATVAAAAAVLLAGCATTVDADQARLCRTILPALNRPGAVIVVQRTAPSDDDRTLRIVYRVQDPGQPARTRFIACRFSGEGLSRDRQTVSAVRTDQGALSDAAMIFLQRYLGDPASALEDPGNPAAAEALPAVPRFAALLIQTLLNALPQIGVYGLVAAAYALIYGLVGRIVFGFGAFAGIAGAATLIGVTAAFQVGTVALFPALGAGLALAVFAALMHGVVSGRLVVQPLVRQSTGETGGLPVLIATTGLMLFLAEYLRLAQGSELHWLPPVLNTPWALARSGDFVATVTPAALTAAGVALVAAVAALATMRLTAFGREWRALADDAKAASLFGVDPDRVFTTTYALSAGLAGLAGFVASAYYGAVGYSYGLTLGLKALVAAVVGGIGSVGGAFAGGIVIGVAEALWSATMPIESRDVAIYALLSIMLALRPGGLFGYRDLLSRRV